MFAAAKVLNLEGELSRILREEGVRSCQVLPTEHALFVNTHPVEIDDLDLMIFSLSELRELEPRRPLVLEIHEAAVTCGDQMRNVRAALSDLRIGLAYDDFGAGQARLVELVDVPPDYLKFDMRLVQNLESASIERQRMLASLVQMVSDLGITPLAEGIELEGDHEICRQMGFECGQGFLYGYPMLAEATWGGSPLRRPAIDVASGLVSEASTKRRANQPNQPHFMNAARAAASSASISKTLSSLVILKTCRISGSIEQNFSLTLNSPAFFCT